MKKWLCVLAALILLLAVFGTSAQTGASDLPYRFFENPEDAILYFVERVAAADFEGALHATAAESMAVGYDLQRMIERIKVFSPSMAMRWPSSTYAEYASLNRIAQEAALERQLYGMISSLLIDPGLYNGMTHMLTDDGLQLNEDDTISLEALIVALDPARLQGLSVQSIYRLDNELYLSEMNQANIANQGASYGYTDAKEFFVRYRFEDNHYAHAYTVVKFPEGWQISSLNAAFMGTNVFGTVIPIPEVEIEDLMPEGDLTKVFEAAQ